MPRTEFTLAFFAVLSLFLPPTADARGYQVLYSFGGGSDGATPEAGPTLDGSGDLYGTTVSGGAFGLGTVYKLTSKGTEIVLHSFSGYSGNDGQAPFSNLIMSSNGKLYGTTSAGGNGRISGTVFEVAKDGSVKLLYSFKGSLADGNTPYSPLAIDGSGDLCGTTYYGGRYSVGTVFCVTTRGTESLLISMILEDYLPYSPYGGLVVGSSGELYGAALGSDSVFSVTGKDINVFSQLCELGGCPNTAYSTLIVDGQGNFYGTTYAGGNGKSHKRRSHISDGAVFKITPAGAGTVLYSFCSQAPHCRDGNEPFAGVIIDTSGNLYGTTSSGGAHDHGTVFEVTPNQTETVLYSFCSQANCVDGTGPIGGLTTDHHGNLYGTTAGGGAYGNGTIFRLKVK